MPALGRGLTFLPSPIHTATLWDGHCAHVCLQVMKLRSGCVPSCQLLGDRSSIQTAKASSSLKRSRRSFCHTFPLSLETTKCISCTREEESGPGCRVK